MIDPCAFAWNDRSWRGIARENLVLYELHIGTFTPEGTFQSAAGRLPDLLDLGITAVELMPVADFPGCRNWGYDRVALFAPARCYGAPDDLRRFVDRAHRLRPFFTHYPLPLGFSVIAFPVIKAPGGEPWLTSIRQEWSRRYTV